MPTFLPIPHVCDNCCSSNIEFVKNDVVYGEERESFNDWPYCWLCYDCRASVYCHKDSKHPKGYMADKQTRGLRNRFHKVFDRLWRNNLLDRDDAYQWLAFQLDLERDECHAGMMSKQKLFEAIQFCETYFEQNFKALVRRMEKRKKIKAQWTYHDTDGNAMPRHEYERVRRQIQRRRAR